MEVRQNSDGTGVELDSDDVRRARAGGEIRKAGGPLTRVYLRANLLSNEQPAAEVDLRDHALVIRMSPDATLPFDVERPQIALGAMADCSRDSILARIGGITVFEANQNVATH
jgi:hypothetical protein